MLTKNFITSSIILFAGFHQYVYAIEDVSFPSQVLQDQRLKELNQQLQDHNKYKTKLLSKLLTKTPSHYRILSI